MKSIKLKPIFFPSNDILVKPPDFIIPNEEIPIEKVKGKSLSSTEELKTILRGKKLKKHNDEQKYLKDEEEDAVKKLSEWKGEDHSKTSLLKKFTFKRGITQNFSYDSKPSNRSQHVAQTVGPIKIKTDTIVSVVQGIVAAERLKRKALETETKGVSERNRQYEENIKFKMNRLAKEIENIKLFIREETEKYETLKKNLLEIEKNHEECLSVISLKEAEELLFNDKGKKKVIKPGDESQYFIKKEKFRQQKQELHKNYQDNKEKCIKKLEQTKRSLDLTERHRLECKKELKTHREEIVLLYCRALKDGKDIRNDGLKWVIKNLWKMNECIPISAFPKFFDDDSAHFLLLMAEKDLELEHCINKLDGLRKEIKSKRSSMSVSTARELYKEVRSRLRNISQSSIGKLADNSFVHEDANESAVILVEEQNSNYVEIKSLREKVVQITEFIKETTNNELKRITDEYQINPGEAEKVGLFHVIRCLVGDKVREFNKYTRSSGGKGKSRMSLLF
ncbi:hypothetical protein SteCoe_13053 [Stentor coeruleus]|uniref:Uncharacterized protein n=1 Tax=Stentor coeruleus TaxID=5963 RepID=A0A1R2C989_9CILI|nr:hypothetical protein SteCoe_13053 [Stentor coeruleus]